MTEETPTPGSPGAAPPPNTPTPEKLYEETMEHLLRLGMMCRVVGSLPSPTKHFDVEIKLAVNWPSDWKGLSPDEVWKFITTLDAMRNALDLGHATAEQGTAKEQSPLPPIPDAWICPPPPPDEIPATPPTSTKDRARIYLQEHPRATAQQLATHLGITVDWVYGVARSIGHKFWHPKKGRVSRRRHRF